MAKPWGVNSSLYGVENVVDRYEKEHHILLLKVPLCDANGTLVIARSNAKPLI